MKKSILAVAAVSVLAFPSCRKISGDIDGDVYYTQDSVYKVEIYAQSNVLDKIETPIENGQLRLQFRKFGNVGSHNRIITRISAPDINGLSVNGSGNLYANQAISSNNMNLKVNGSGNITIASYTGNDLIANVNGSGRIAVNGGSVKTEDLRISGSGDLDLLNLQAENVTVHTSGSGSTSVYATRTLDVHISGSGDVYYRGTPSVSTSISGSGKVTHQ